MGSPLILTCPSEERKDLLQISRWDGEITMFHHHLLEVFELGFQASYVSKSKLPR